MSCTFFATASRLCQRMQGAHLGSVVSQDGQGSELWQVESRQELWGSIFQEAPFAHFLPPTPWGIVACIRARAESL